MSGNGAKNPHASLTRAADISITISETITDNNEVLESS